MPADIDIEPSIARITSKSPVDLEIGRLAGRQHGVVSRPQLVAIGLSRTAIDHRLRRGRLIPLFRGVYAVGHDAITTRSRWMAAVLFAGDGAVLSHASAAALWGIGSDSSVYTEITARHEVRRLHNIRPHSRSLPDDEVTTTDAIPVTSVPRTLLDIAATRPASLEQALELAEVLRLTDALSLPDLIARYPKRRGTRAAATALLKRGSGSTATESELEVLFAAFVERHRLPRPEWNIWLEAEGSSIRVDCLWRDARLIAELDSRTYHQTIAMFESDRQRDRSLQTQGWRVIRITWRQIKYSPEIVARDLRALVAKPRLRR